MLAGPVQGALELWHPSPLVPAATLVPVAARASASHSSVEVEEGEPVDLTRLRDMVDDDPAVMRELIDVYLVESEELMGGLRVAMKTGSTSETERLAHKLGGSSAMCGMMGIVAPLHELEMSAKAGQWPENEDLLREAGRQHDRIRACLQAYILTTLGAPPVIG
jgi:HPt (histidine-containing phosphotransfer) domain-containing protein